MDDNHDSIKPKYVKILTDSQAALKALDSIDFKSTMALKTAEALENLKWRTKGCTIGREWKRKWHNTPHYKHTKHFYRGPDKNRARKILNISRSHLTRLISIITGFNCLSYIQ